MHLIILIMEMNIAHLVNTLRHIDAYLEAYKQKKDFSFIMGIGNISSNNNLLG